MKGRVFINVEKCVACKRCVLGCAVEHSASKEFFAALHEVPAPRSRVRMNVVEGAAVPAECRHCDAAACVAACPTKALYKDGADGPVLLHGGRCVGCSSCVVACPYGVVRPGRAGEPVYKCDLCVERLQQGRLPACVESCPTHCLTFRSGEQLRGWLQGVGVATRTFTAAVAPGEERA